MSQEKLALTVEEVSYSWTNDEKTKFVLHHDGTGIVQGSVDPSRKSFSIEIDGKGISTYSRMKDAKEEAALLWAKGHRVPLSGSKSVIMSSSTSLKSDQAQYDTSLAREQEVIEQGLFTAEAFPYLHKEGECTPPRKRLKNLAQDIAKVKAVVLCAEYIRLQKCAPRRTNYFVRHTGVPTGKKNCKRYEEHLAMALWNLKNSWPRPDCSQFCLLDYQFPLKAPQSNQDPGEIDLLGITRDGRLMIIEMKVMQRNGSRGETPLAAMIQGLRYAAYVQANQDAIAREAEIYFNVMVAAEQPPIVLILAPEDWWCGWTELSSKTRSKAGPWEPTFVKLASEIEEQVGLNIECATLKVERKQLTFGGDGRSPLLERMPELKYLRLGSH